MPIKIKVESFYRNATIFRRGEAPQMPASPINRGLGKEMDLAATEIPLTYKQDERNNPCAIVTLADDGETLGTWLLSTAFRVQVAPQTFTHAGETTKSPSAPSASTYPTRSSSSTSPTTSTQARKFQRTTQAWSASAIRRSVSTGRP